MREIRFVAHAAMCVSVISCAGIDGRSRVSDSTFVAAVAQLRLIEVDTSLDSTRRSAARAAALVKFGVTAEELERTSRKLATDPERAVGVWKAIDQRLQPAPPAKEP